MLKQKINRWNLQNKNKDNLFISQKIFQELSYVQNRLMSLPSNYDLWMRESNLQNEWQRHMLVQEVYQAQRAHQNVIAMGDRNTKFFFQVAVTIRKRQNYIQKIIDENGIWSEDQTYFVGVFKRSYKEIQKDSNVNMQMAIPLRSDISDAENNWLTTEITMEEVWQVVK